MTSLADEGSDTTSRTMDRKDLLLTAAAELFDEQHFEGVTVDAVAERAGVARGLVAYYFGNKEGLYRAVRERFNSTLRHRLLDNHQTDPLRWLEADVQTFLHVIEEHPMAMRNTTQSRYSRSPDGAPMESFTVARILAALAPTHVDDPLLRTVIGSWGVHAIDLALRWLNEPSISRDDIAAVLVVELRAAITTVAKAHPEYDLPRSFGGRRRR